MIYITDGTFEGILTAVFEAYERKEEPDSIISKDMYQMTLGSLQREVITDSGKYERVYKAITEKISTDVMEVLYRAFLNENPDVGLEIYNYIRIGLKIGKKVISYLQNPHILRVHDMSYKVMAEVHLFYGILRFKKLKNGIYYARIEPDNNIAMLLANHFAERMSDQPWIIHDAKRNIYALYNTENVVFSSEYIPVPLDKQDDKEFELLWRRYFKAIAIESRYNPKLQKSFMPRRYWNNLIEKQISD